MPVERQVLSRSAPFPHGVTSDHGVTEERPYVEDLGLALLVLEAHEVDVRIALLSDVDAAVAHRVKGGSASLLGVGSVEIVPAGDEGLMGKGGDRKAVRAIVSRSLR